MLPRSKLPKSTTGAGDGVTRADGGSERRPRRARLAGSVSQPRKQVSRRAPQERLAELGEVILPGAAHRGELGEGRGKAGGLDQLAILEPALVPDVLVIDPGERAGMFGSTNATTTSGRWSTVVDGASHAEEGTAVDP